MSRCSKNEDAAAPGPQAVGLSLVCALAAGACLVHLLVSRYMLGADALWFTLCGAAFLAVTIASHLVLARSAAVDSGALGPLGPLLVSMAIRLAGTFAILGLLLWLSPLERPEAVFNVLFWYITLTATDLTALVRQRRQMDSFVGAGAAAGAAGAAGADCALKSFDQC